MQSSSSEADLRDVNQKYYDALWRDAKLVSPERFNTWPKVSAFAATAKQRLEVAPGLRPRLPIEGTEFLDISAPALAALAARGGRVQQGSILALPYDDARFDLVCALDIVEHVDDDETALAELSRVAAPGATLLVSTPFFMAAWTPFDEFVGHRRRYEPEDFVAKLSRYGFTIEQSAIYGMQPKSSKLLDLGMWYLTHKRERAMWWYNRVFMPLGLRAQKALDWQPGLLETTGVDEALMICRKA
jgi:SAM-dependent methyltransferase